MGCPLPATWGSTAVGLTHVDKLQRETLEETALLSPANTQNSSLVVFRRVSLLICSHHRYVSKKIDPSHLLRLVGTGSKRPASLVWLGLGFQSRGASEAEAQWGKHLPVECESLA